MGDSGFSGQVEKRRPPGWVVQNLGRTLQEYGKENIPGMNEAQNQERQQSQGDKQIEGVDTGQNPPPVQPVGQHSGYQRQRRARTIQENGNQSDLKGRVGQFVNEVSQHQQFHAARDFVNPPSRPHQAEVRVLQDH